MHNRSSALAMAAILAADPGPANERPGDVVKKQDLGARVHAT